MAIGLKLLGIVKCILCHLPSRTEPGASGLGTQRIPGSLGFHPLYERQAKGVPGGVERWFVNLSRSLVSYKRLLPGQIGAAGSAEAVVACGVR